MIFFLPIYPGSSDGLFQKVQSSIGSALDFDTDDSQCTAIMGTSPAVAKRSLVTAAKGTFPFNISVLKKHDNV